MLDGYHNTQVKQHVPQYILPYVKFYAPVDHLISIFQKDNEAIKSQDDEERKKQLTQGQQHFDNGMAQLNKRCSNPYIELETLSAALIEFQLAATLNPTIFVIQKK